MRSFRKKSVGVQPCSAPTTPNKPINAYERSSSCFTFRKGDELDQDNLKKESTIGKSISSRSFGTFNDALNRPSDPNDLNKLTADDRYIIEYLTNQYHKELLDDEPNDMDDQKKLKKGGIPPAKHTRKPYVTAWDLFGPTGWCLFLVVAIYMADISLCILYFQKKKFQLFWQCTLIPNAVCVVLLVERLIEARRKLSFGCFRLFVTLWYFLTTPLLRFLPLITLMSSCFDKVMMFTGDPTDTTEFVLRYEMRAFNDLVWLGSLYCLPMAGFQLNTLLFDKVSKDINIYRFQLISVTGSVLLAAVVASTYASYARLDSAQQDSEVDLLRWNSSKNSHKGFIFIRSFAWLPAVAAKVLTVAILNEIVGPTITLGIVLTSRLPIVIVVSLLSSVGWKVCEVLSVSLITTTYVVPFLRLGEVRELLASAGADLLHLGVVLAETSLVFVACYLTKTIKINERFFAFAVAESVLITLAGLIFFVSHRFVRRRTAVTQV